jgi:beta-galactosidase
MRRGGRRGAARGRRAAAPLRRRCCAGRAAMPLLLIVAAAAAAALSSTVPRSRVSLDFGWKFKAFPTLGPSYFTAQDYPPSEWPNIAAPAFNDTLWRSLNVPHDFVIDGDFNMSVVPAHACGHCMAYLTPGVGWYRKTWVVPAAVSGKAATLTFDGVFRNATVWLNGARLGRHSSGYTSFHFAVGHLLLPGKRNTLVVRADATLKEGWWYEGGGIYRHTWLTTYSKAAYIAPWGVRVISNVETEAEGATAVLEDTAQRVEVSVEVALGNDSPTATPVLVHTEIFDLQNNSLAIARSAAVVTVPPGAALGDGSAAASVTVNTSAQLGLWSIETPRLYRVVTSLLLHEVEQVLDQVSVRFAPRKIAVTATGGLTLNGKHVKLKGVANHMDFAGLGNALPDRVQWFKVHEMKRMGVNAWRCAPSCHHAPPHIDSLINMI